MKTKIVAVAASLAGILAAIIFLPMSCTSRAEREKQVTVQAKGENQPEKAPANLTPEDSKKLAALGYSMTPSEAGIPYNPDNSSGQQGGIFGGGGGQDSEKGDTAWFSLAEGDENAPRLWYDLRSPLPVREGVVGPRFNQGGRRGSARGIRTVSFHKEELWIIQKPETTALAGPDAPGTGALLATVPGETKKVSVPLKHTDVQAHISAYIATVDVTQKYENPYDAKIEAVYVFPLPENAAINEFIMTIGERRIRGIIRERKEAEQVYHEARAQGHMASLLTQERANVFTQKVANIEPGKTIDINIKYLHTLAYDDGWYEYVFPMVVGPRYNPAHTTTGIDAVARGQAGASKQPTAVEYLKPGERSGHDIALTLDIDAGVAVEDVRSVNHVIETKQEDPARTSIRLSAMDAIPNKDFVLRYKVAGDRLKTALLTHESDKGRYFSLMLYPPDDLTNLARAPMEMIFVIDCSGSMNGQPIAQAKAAVAAALQQLRPDDTFQIVQFSDTASQFGAAPLAVTPRNIQQALNYVQQLDGEGGTEMINGIRAALDFPHDPRRLRFVSFLTDGFIGNEAEILGEIHAKLGDSRIFSFGVGSAPNRYLMDRMAVMGRGAAAYLSLNDNGADVMDRFFARISHPALTDVALDFGTMQVEDVYPSRELDLFVGRPIILTGRYRGEGTPSIRVTGRAGGRT
ncbi:MAG TPA: VIT domain-containing protein, partial [Phycisphaerae bacterium]|nr:VIT domain-containing protein [Phycisphaerae bacterium]